MANALDILYTRAVQLADGLSSGELIGEVVAAHPDTVRELQERQLLGGKASSGDDLRPYYSEDLKPSGFFHSKESAGRYAAWKQSLSYPYSVSRNGDAPNLYIDGKFYGELDYDIGERVMRVRGGSAYARRIVEKYGEESFGLSAESWRAFFRERGGLAELLNKAKTLLYAK